VTDSYWQKLVATPAERQRGEALNHSIDHLRRAIAAIEAATAGETNGYRRGALEEVHEGLRGLERALRLLSV